MTSDTTDYAGLIAELRDEADKHPPRTGPWTVMCEQAADAIEALLAREAALRKDAERLKYVCSRMIQVELSPDGLHKWIFKNMPMYGANAQAAIDALIAELAKGKANE